MLRYLGFPYILFYQKELGLLKYMQESLIFKFIGTIFMKVWRGKKSSLAAMENDNNAKYNILSKI